MKEEMEMTFLPPILVTIPIDVVLKSGFPTRKEVLEHLMDGGIIPIGISTKRNGVHYLESKEEIEKNKQIYLFTVFGVFYKNLPEC